MRYPIAASIREYKSEYFLPKFGCSIIYEQIKAAGISAKIGAVILTNGLSQKESSVFI